MAQQTFTAQIAQAHEAADLAASFLESLADAPEAMEGGEAAVRYAFQTWAAEGQYSDLTTDRAWAAIRTVLF